LLGEPADRGAVSCFDFPASAPLAGAPVRAFLAADGLLLVVLFLAGLLASCSSLETTSVTPYNAPRTRIASSRGSFESRVSFKAVAFRCVRDMAAQAARGPSRYKQKPSRTQTALRQHPPQPEMDPRQLRTPEGRLSGPVAPPESRTRCDSDL
jgi:hypothetical protein